MYIKNVLGRYIVMIRGNVGTNRRSLISARTRSEALSLAFKEIN